MEELKYKANDQYTGIKLTYDGHTPDQRGRRRMYKTLAHLDSFKHSGQIKTQQGNYLLR